MPLGLFALLAHRGQRFLCRHGWASFLLLFPIGLVAWALAYNSGVHATVAGVLLALGVPVRPPSPRSSPTRGSDSPAPGGDPDTAAAEARGLAEILEHTLSLIHISSVRPQDDLFRHVNGRWLARTEIPADKQAAGAFIDLRDAAEQAIRVIVTGLAGAEPGTEAYLVEHMFGSFMDIEGVEAKGLAPLAPLLAEIDAIGTVEDLLDYFGRSLRRGIGAPLGVEVESDLSLIHI